MRISIMTVNGEEDTGRKMFAANIMKKSIRQRNEQGLLVAAIEFRVLCCRWNELTSPHK
jgi:hypothetical protein